MAYTDIKISEFPTVVGNLTGNEFFPVLQGGVNKKAALSQISIGPLGLGTMSLQNADNVNITGGQIVSSVIVGAIPEAANIAGGAANRIAYQTSVGATAFIAAPTVANTYLEWSGSAFQWSANPLGTVTSVAALTIGTTGTDITSTVADPTTTPVITLNIPTASAVNRGALSSADWSTFNAKQNALTAGTGISLVGDTVTNTAPDQVVSITGAGTSVVTGTYPNFTVTSADQYVGTVTSVDAIAGTGISVSGGPITSSGSITITNTAPDQVVSITGAGTSVVTGTYPNFTVTSADQYVGTVTSVDAIAGTGISVSGGPITSSGSITITNTAPDQIVALTGTGTTSVTGTYPNFTINSADQYVGTVTSIDLTAGTGISVSGGPITSSGSITVTNTAPDQVVSITGAGTTSVTGTYPNFTVTSNDQYVGTVTSVDVSGGTTGLSFTGGPITTSGTITLGGTLAIANGGTNGTASPVSGAVAYGTGTAYGFTAAGTAGQVLVSNGTSAPSFGGVDGGTF